MLAFSTLAANFDIPEVCIFFNLKLYRGNRTKKIDSWGIDAFGSPNFPPLALMGTQVNVRSDLVCAAPKRRCVLSFALVTNRNQFTLMNIFFSTSCFVRFRVSTTLCTNIYVLQMVPGFEDSGLIEFAKNPENRRKGIVLALYGTGNAPSRRKGYDC